MAFLLCIATSIPTTPEPILTTRRPRLGFAAQLGFRLPNMVISPFSRQHYVSHIPMDHTAIIKFVENRFIGNGTHLDRPRCCPAGPAGLLRLQPGSVGNTAYPADAQPSTRQL